MRGEVMGIAALHPSYGLTSYSAATICWVRH